MKAFIQICRKLLYPISVVYGMITSFRNKLFDYGILPSNRYEIPIISVGNLAVGGTGKTPHIEYLIRLLSEHYKVATLSRGYGRKTKSFVKADNSTTATDIGDEPFQIYEKFGNKTVVAVDENRCHGVDTLLTTQSKLNVILLDDAFQHRYIKPGLSILLTDYNNPFHKDCMMPTGNLRESQEGKKRADIVIVSKCPKSLSTFDCLRLQKELKTSIFQDVYFTTFSYKNLSPIDKNNHELVPKTDLTTTSILLITGIANADNLKEYLRQNAQEVKHLPFADHHEYSIPEIQKIFNTYESMSAENKIIVTTEKDLARLCGMNLPDKLYKNMYSIGIEVTFLHHKEIEFNKKILDYVGTNN